MWGKGKLEEIALICQVFHADLLIFDDELSASQINNIESVVGIKVIDRTSLILDIFAREPDPKKENPSGTCPAKIQNFKAFRAWKAAFKAWGGGIGTRGPGRKSLKPTGAI